MADRVNLNRRAFVALTAGIAGGLLVKGAQGQAGFPAKPGKVIVGFAPGGATDILGRLAAQAISEKLGQPFVVENRSGAGGNIATLAVVSAPPDGHTLLATTCGQIVVSPHTDPSLKFDPMKDLKHITMIAEGDFILAVHPAVPANTIQEFIALAKKNPGKYNYGTAGAGSNLHLFTEYFLMAAGINVQAVHYRGGAALTPDLLSGQIQVSLNGIHAFDSYFKQGKLKPLLVIGKQREPRIPDIPTAREIGMPQLEVCTNWFGLHAPAATPEPVIRLLNASVVDHLKTEPVKEKLSGMGMRAMADTPENFAARLAVDSKIFADVAKKANIQIS